MNVQVKDPLGDRMKGYEAAYKTRLPENSWAAVRFDGRSFSRWTKGLERPYDLRLNAAMAQATRAACEAIGGSVIGYTQSDEITVVFSDRGSAETEMWFGGSVQKIASIGASLVTAHFAREFPDRPIAMFDARVFSVPSAVEAANCLRWRWLDCVRNSYSMEASAIFSPKQLHGKSTEERRQMLEDAGVDLSTTDPRFRYGQVLYRAEREITSYVRKDTGETVQLDKPAIRRVWESMPSPELTADPDGWLLPQLVAAESGT